MENIYPTQTFMQKHMHLCVRPPSRWTHTQMHVLWYKRLQASTYSVEAMFLKSSKSLMESCAATSTVLSCSRLIWLSRRRS